MSISYDQYMRFVSETFDLSDDKTREMVLSEDHKSQVAQDLTSKLYDQIVAQVDDIDFGTIPQSKGDITKIENYEGLIECLGIMSKLVSEYRENPYAINTVSQAINNIQSRKAIFQKAYALNIEYPIVLYNVMTLGCVASVSFLITSCIEYIKNADDTYSSALKKAGYKNTMNYALFKSLEKFNRSCENGSVDKALETTISMNMKSTVTHEFSISSAWNAVKGAKGAVKAGYIGLAVVLGLFTIGTVGLPYLRDMVYCITAMRQSASEYFTNIADALTLNASNLEYRDTKNPNKDEVYQKQMNIANKFRKLSDIVAVKMKRADAATKALINNAEKTKYTIDDISSDLF